MRSISQKSKRMHSHQLSKQDTNLPSSQGASSHGHNLLLKPFSTEKGGKKGAQRPSFQHFVLILYTQLSLHYHFQFLPYKSSGKVCSQSPAMLEALSPSISHLDTLIPSGLG